MLRLFRKKETKRADYDPARMTPVIRTSICNGEKAAGFRDSATGRIHEVMLIRTNADLDAFRAEYGIKGPIETIY